MNLTPFKNHRIFLALLLLGLLSLTSCGSHGGDGTSSTIPNTSKSFIPGTVELRWFPVADARGYLIEITDPNGQMISDQMASPTGCTHDTLEGYTSGLCSFVFRLPESGKTYTVRLKSFNEEGESERAVKTIRW